MTGDRLEPGEVPTFSNTGGGVTPRNVNCLSWWFPRLVAAGIPVPETRIVPTLPDLRGWDLDVLADSGAWPNGFAGFQARLFEAGDAIARKTSWPVFLRTGHTSGKFHWRDTCRWLDRPSVQRHVARLVIFSHEADIFGLPTDVWVVREMLKTEPICDLPRYGGLPLVGEVRAFVSGGAVVCLHPYWNRESIRQGLAEEVGGDTFDAVSVAAATLYIEEVKPLAGLLQAVATAFEDFGGWSVDCLPTADRGWVVTDMAAAERSWHDPVCPESHMNKSKRVADGGQEGEATRAGTGPGASAGG